ncbi:MAG TPA: AgmX/PglI C-terminal domain-containing protein [Labilithrix sp.]|jgi:outer membrane biosynthesis protein TonB
MRPFDRVLPLVLASASCACGSPPAQTSQAPVVETAASASPDAGPPPALVFTGLSPAEVRAVVLSHLGAVRYCYELEAQKDATLEGNVTVGWEIDTSGHVTSTRIVDATLESERVKGCIMRQIASWSFPANERPTIVGAFPFRFGVAKK